MKRVIIYCEGPSEETFINRILYPGFQKEDIYLTAISCRGVSKYSLIRKDLLRLCRSDSAAVVTMMLDYYGMPSDTPGIREKLEGSVYDKIKSIEKSIGQDIAASNFVPNLILHEYETLLFSDVTAFSQCMEAKSVGKLQKIRKEFSNPEEINNSPDTAPSKRILKICPQYRKVVDGCSIAEAIGLTTIRKECRHFNEWLEQIESKGKGNER